VPGLREAVGQSCARREFGSMSHRLDAVMENTFRKAESVDKLLNKCAELVARDQFYKTFFRPKKFTTKFLSLSFG
jgi:hypothetical protein